MKEKPILFSGPMVNAILDGRKTQTRRAVKHCTQNSAASRPYFPGGYKQGKFVEPTDCPYGQPGDRLWVRETWGRGYTYGGGDPVFWYRADGESRFEQKPSVICDYTRPPDNAKWKPSIFMPRWASRITLEITDVRVERLRDISEEDSWEEGIHDLAADNEQWDGDPDQGRKTFCLIWQSINGKGSWEQNPWVWVVSFRKI